MQNAIKLENISNLITSPSSYQCRKTRLVHFVIHGRHTSMEWMRTFICLWVNWSRLYINKLRKKCVFFNPYNSVTNFFIHLLWKFTFGDAHIFDFCNISSSCDVVYKGRWLTQAGYWFILRFCGHFTCLSS
jgi:hypothetical protein